MNKNCVDCNKESEDIFYLNYNELIDPFTGAIESIGNGFCLSCYRKKANQMQMRKAQIQN
jgi:hypothetical protein